MNHKMRHIISLIASIGFLLIAIHNFSKSLNSLLLVFNSIGVVLFSFLTIVSIKRLLANKNVK